ncbi:MAG: 50S ribosome-binding GTPase [Syntrophomonadaceae bacterium]|nr:50S ribosome-binding GTPase [Syntrophomonadaceae bacterium]
MPANLTPQYYIAEEAYKKAASVEDKVAALEDMLAVIPKHKGTEKLQADIKSRLAKLRKEGEKKKTSARFDPFNIPKEGAGQVAVFGCPNTGKSSLVGSLTRAKVQVGDYPFTTTIPVTGMMPYENVMVQLVDLPPITADTHPPGLSGLLRRADAILLVVDASDGDCPEQVQIALDYLQAKRIIGSEPAQKRAEGIPVLIAANKGDLPGSAGNAEIMRELIPAMPELMLVSARTGINLEQLKNRLFQMIEVIRVYTRAPGKEADRTAPMVLPEGSSILDLAYLIHRDFPERLKGARIWGSAKFDGQSVPREYVLADHDVVELIV